MQPAVLACLCVPHTRRLHACACAQRDQTLGLELPALGCELQGCGQSVLSLHADTLRAAGPQGIVQQALVDRASSLSSELGLLSPVARLCAARGLVSYLPLECLALPCGGVPLAASRVQCCLVTRALLMARWLAHLTQLHVTLWLVGGSMCLALHWSWVLRREQCLGTQGWPAVEPACRWRPGPGMSMPGDSMTCSAVK